MPPEQRTRDALGHLRVRLLPELARRALTVARLREELADWTRQAEELDERARKLTSQMEGERAGLLARGPLCGAALSGRDQVRARQRARLLAVVAARDRALQRGREVSGELACHLGLLRNSRLRLEVVQKRHEQARRAVLRREADDRLEALVEDCAGRPAGSVRPAP